MKQEHYITLTILSLLCTVGLSSHVAAVDADTVSKADVVCKDGTIQVKLGSIEDYKKACETAKLGEFQKIATTMQDNTKPTSVKCTDNNDPYNCTPKTTFAFAGCGKDDVGIRCLMTEILKFLSIGVGIAVVGGIIAGGIVYSTAEGNPSKTQSGIKIIANSVLALIIYFLMYAIINFLVPGGVFG